MKRNQVCPKCASKKLWIVNEVRRPLSDRNPATEPLYAARVSDVPSEETGFWAASSKRVDAGTFEIWICAGCGLTEWYAKDFEEKFARLAALPNPEVRRIG